MDDDNSEWTDAKWKEGEREWKLTKCHQRSGDNKIIKHKTDGRAEEEKEDERRRFHHRSCIPFGFWLLRTEPFATAVYGSRCLDPDETIRHVYNKSALFSFACTNAVNYGCILLPRHPSCTVSREKRIRGTYRALFGSRSLFDLDSRWKPTDRACLNEYTLLPVLEFNISVRKAHTNTDGE